MDLETPYLMNCKKLSKISGFSIEELFDKVVALVIDKKHEYYGEIGLYEDTLYGNGISGMVERIKFSDKKTFDFYNEFKKEMPKQIDVTKNIKDILKQKEKMKFPGKI